MTFAREGSTSTNNAAAATPTSLLARSDSNGAALGDAVGSDTATSADCGGCSCCSCCGTVCGGRAEAGASSTASSFHGQHWSL